MSLFTLNKADRLKSRKAISRLFSEGKSFSQFPLKVFYFRDSPRPLGSKGFKFSVSVPKKSFPKAVDRNRIKRKLREAYRLNKQLLDNKTSSSSTELQMMFVYISKKEEDRLSIANTVKACLQKLQTKA